MAVHNPYAEVIAGMGFFTSTPRNGIYPVLPPIPALCSPLAPYYSPNHSNSYSSVSSGSASNQKLPAANPSTDSCSPPPHLVPYNTPLSEDSGISSITSPTESTPVTRTTVRGYKRTYCTICKVNINKEGKRSQGPRRHLLQHHVRRPLFQCPHCSHSSFYDKFHVTSHMRRIHQDNSDRLINRSSEFEEEVDKWYQRCFGEASYKQQSEERIEPRLTPLYSSPPPVLSPEPSCKENTDPDSIKLLSPKQVPPLKKRRVGFMVADLLELSPEKTSTHLTETEEGEG